MSSNSCATFFILISLFFPLFPKDVFCPDLDLRVFAFVQKMLCAMMVVIYDGAKIVYLNCRYILWPSTWSVGMHARSRSYPSIGLLPIAFSRSPLGEYCKNCKYLQTLEILFFISLNISAYTCVKSMLMAPGWRIHCRPAQRSFWFSTSLWSEAIIISDFCGNNMVWKFKDTKWCVTLEKLEKVSCN